jgi:uncharacterized protein DUF6599
MGYSKFILIGAVVLWCLAPGFAQSTSKTSTSILPQQFGGWQISGTIKTSTDPATADPANAALLKEYGFASVESATYLRSDGRKLSVKAARFADASGTYGAFTFYKTPQMLKEEIGDQAASLNERVLFYRGNILVDAVFQKLSAMSAAELRELASDLPPPPANAAGLPGLPAYLPRHDYQKNTAKYVMGPLALQAIGAPVPAQLVNFDDGAEVALAKYKTQQGDATLMLISYPTPQIAEQRFGLIEAAHKNAGAQAGADLSLENGTFFDKRTGPIVAVITGTISDYEAKGLLGAVNYDASVTWNENTYFSKRDNIGSIVVTALILSAIIMLFALALGLAFGGVRIALKRLFPNRVFDRPEQVEFISLHLEEDRAPKS